MCFETWLLDCGWAFNTSLLTKFLRQTEGFECVIRNAATHDSNSLQWWSLDSVFHRRVLPLSPNTLFLFPWLSFLHFVLKSLSLPSPPHVSLFPPSVPSPHNPSCPSLRSRPPSLAAFICILLGELLFFFRINYRSHLRIFVSRQDCTIGSAR